MKMFLISDNVDTLLGLRLAGIDGTIVNSEADAKEAINNALADKEIVVLIITEKLSKMYPSYTEPIKLEKKLPLLLEIPDRHGTGRDPNSITNFINAAIGIKIK